ncbi:MAG TPA: hypothetical protein VGD97_07915 [Lacunisphaera sp.]
MKKLLTALRLAGVLAMPALAAGATESDDKAVELPPFVVTKLVFGPPWRYAEIPGYEILSQCSDTETYEIVAALWRGPQLVLPPAMQPRFSLPMTVVLFNQPPTNTAGAPAPEFDEPTGQGGSKWVKLIKRTLDDRRSYAINLWPESFDRPSTYRFDTATLLGRRAPTAPVWLQAGLSGPQGLYRAGVHWVAPDKEKTVPAATWHSNEERQRALQLIDIARKRLSLGGRGLAPSSLAAFLPPMTVLFEDGPPADAVAAARWSSMAALFVRWGLYGRTPANPAQFWRFAERACAEPMSETLFRECFDRSYADVHAELSWYLPIALKDEGTAPVDDMRPVPRITLREATGTEIARLRGEWERMEAAVLAPRFPDLAQEYREQAAGTLNRAYLKGSRDPRLLASMGLLALDNGELTLAARHLEQAVDARVAGVRPYLEAARLRWAAAVKDESAAVPPEVLAGIINLLMITEQQEPPQAAVYLLLAKAVAQGGPATPEQAAALRRGLTFFPRLSALHERIQAALNPGVR